ncbi:MAG: glycosyltransferase family 39 protein [Deltaproteobacteria bacterium]|nr:glycosyltransferase family 39 protein [Deltaproteobacteria bacterium]MBW2446019.1 glycosyltransferase family 39 protein [Deltaproteobacteria bacterium]
MDPEPVAATGGAESAHPLAASQPLSPRSHALAVVGLAALAVAVRVVVWLRAGAMMNDGPTFIGIARKFAEGAWQEAFAHAYHPLYPLLMAGVHPWVSDWEKAGVVVSIASSVLAVVFLYDFLRRAFGGWVPVVGCLLLAVHPYAVPFSADVQSEGLYMAWFLGAVALGWRTLESPRLAPAVGAGVLSGLAYLTRPEGLGVALAVAVVLASLGLRRKRTPSSVARSVGAVGLGAVLLAAPYAATLGGDGGEVRLTRKKSAVVIATLDSRNLDKAPLGPRSGKRGLRGVGVPTRVWHSVSEVAGVARHSFRLDHWLIAGLGAVAVGGPAGLRAGFVAALAGLYLVVLVGLQATSGYVSMRHALPPLLPLLGYVALGVPSLGRVALFLPRVLARRGPASPRVALLVGLVILVGASAAMATRPQRQDRAAPRAAAEWLATHGGAKRIAATKERDAYYAQANFSRLPRPVGRDGVDWIERLRGRHVRYAIIDERTARDYPELGGAVLDPRLRVLHTAEAYGHKASVVEIVGVRGVRSGKASGR